MLKTESKRRRTKQQIEEDKLEEVQKENEMRAKLAAIQQLQAEKEQMQQIAQSNSDAANLMSNLINAGILKQISDSSFMALGPKGE